MKISDKYRKSVPLNVTLLDHTNKSLTIAWDFIPEATSYTVQLLGSPDAARIRGKRGRLL